MQRQSIPSTIVAILIGGRGTRMGGREKALLPIAPGETILDRQLAVCATAGLPVILVGGAPETQARYPDVAWRADAAESEGPIAALRALCDSAPAAYAILIGCDMPFISVKLLDQLATAPPCARLVPRRDERWEVLCARYDLAANREAARRHRSLRRLCEEPGTVELALNDEAGALVDWDSPIDLP